MCKKNINIKLKEGLNLLNCMRIARFLSNFKANVLFKKGRQSADARSIIELLSLGASRGDGVAVIVHGQDEEKVTLELESLLTGAKK